MPRREALLRTSIAVAGTTELEDPTTEAEFRNPQFMPGALMKGLPCRGSLLFPSSLRSAYASPPT